MASSSPPSRNVGGVPRETDVLCGDTMMADQQADAGQTLAAGTRRYRALLGFNKVRFFELWVLRFQNSGFRSIGAVIVVAKGNLAWTK